MVRAVHMSARGKQIITFLPNSRGENIMTTVSERFLRYVSFDTKSDEASSTCPSTAQPAEQIECATRLGCGNTCCIFSSCLNFRCNHLCSITFVQRIQLCACANCNEHRRIYCRCIGDSLCQYYAVTLTITVCTGRNINNQVWRSIRDRNRQNQSVA